MKITKDQVEFLRRVALYLSTDDQDVLAYETQLLLLGQQIETSLVLKINDKTRITLKLEEPA